VGSTLARWENSSVDSSLHIRLLVFPEEDETSSGTTKSLVGGGSDNVTEFEWAGLLAGSNKTRDVSHVTEKVCTLSIGNLPQSAVVPITGVGGTTTDDKSGLKEVGVGLELGVVDDTGLSVDSVGERLKVDG
jgi:hypothetical protein